jgi:hypothetical protein
MRELGVPSSRFAVHGFYSSSGRISTNEIAFDARARALRIPIEKRERSVLEAAINTEVVRIRRRAPFNGAR